MHAQCSSRKPEKKMDLDESIIKMESMSTVKECG